MTWLREPIVTDRLLLRSIVSGDERAVAALFTDADVRRYLGGPLGAEEAESRIGPFSIEPQDEWWGHFVIVDRIAQDVIGTLSFAIKSGPWEISYQLRRNLWGRGLAKEAIEAAFSWFWVQQPSVDRVIANTRLENTRSLNLLNRLGGRLEREFEHSGALHANYVFLRATNHQRPSDDTELSKR